MLRRPLLKGIGRLRGGAQQLHRPLHKVGTALKARRVAVDALQRRAGREQAVLQQYLGLSAVLAGRIPEEMGHQERLPEVGVVEQSKVEHQAVELKAKYQ